MGAAAPFLAIASAGMSLVGGIAQAASARSAAKATSAANERAAIEASQGAAMDAHENALKTRRFMGSQMADMTALGADVSGGSALDIAFESARAAETDELNLLEAGSRERRSYLERASAARREGRAAATGAIISGVGQALQKGSEIAQWYK